MPKVPLEIKNRGDLAGVSPIDFLAILKQQRHQVYLFNLEVDHWVTKKDLRALVGMKDSKAPSSSVMMAHSSYIDGGNSTEGQEALCMIAAVKIGRYPPWLNSTRPQESTEELIEWAKAELQGE